VKFTVDELTCENAVDTAFVEQKNCPINEIRIHFKTILPVV
jgi:hypothetical protein